MRLLERNSAGEVIPTKDFIDDNEVPPYAILSHTWVEGEEVTFEDLTNNTGKNKLGYEKIRFCGEQARQDGLEYFWVDTCCIDKSNSVELHEAINSMFRWYQKAAKCYVYLLDVSTIKRKASDQSFEIAWESAFRESRWFRRCWTLQELLAPGSVEFFSRDRKRLGDKRTLERQIHEVTKIAVPALRGTPLSQFGVEERLSWAEDRHATRKEDKSYSMLGIFDIQMPLLYGEGEQKALKRLRREIRLEIDPVDRLPYAAEAPFNSYTKQHEPACLPNTRVDLLQTIYNWADGQDERCIFWLNGLAGTGKSTIARTVARRYFDNRRLGASFFFSRGGGDVGHAGKFCTTVAMQLAEHVPILRQHICDAITGNSNITSLSLDDQWRRLVLQPLSKLSGNSCPSSYVVVIDALDECNNDNNIRAILHLLAEARSLRTVRLRVFLTSRPEIPVRYGFRQIPDAEHQDFILHKVLRTIVDHDIFIFLEYNLRLIGQERSLDSNWPGEEIIRYLVQTASGLFIWAATTCRFVREGKRFAIKRLDTILNGSRITVTEPEKHLDEIYTAVLKHSISAEYTDEEKEESYSMLRQILGSIAVLFSPLSICSLSRLLCVTREDIDQTMEDLHSILDVPKDETHPLRLHHPSFRDFLLNNDRCKDRNFWVDKRQAHQSLAESCLRLMRTSLRQDICELDAPGVLIDEVDSSRVEQYLPSEFQYACLYWVEHLKKSGAQLHDNDQVHQFLQTHLLHWLEALSWMRKMSEGILSIHSLESVALICDCPQLYAFIHDVKRFVLNCRPAIEQAPLQTYCSALIFAPVKSIVRMQFKDRIPKWIRRLPDVLEDWSASLQTLEDHTGWVHSVAFSRDGTLLVSGGDRTVRLWDAATGAALKTLEGHTDEVYSVALSHDGSLLASGSLDRTVRVWDAVAGATLKTLEGHMSGVHSVALSPDGALLASGSRDMTVRLWDIVTGTAPKTLEGHTGEVLSVAFTHDGVLLASGSRDKAIKLWDIVTGAALKTLEGHTDDVLSVAFSHDGALLASGANNVVWLWDAATGATLKTLEGRMYGVSSLAFSHDDSLLVSGSYDKTIRLWDAVTGALLKTLEGHMNGVCSVALSHDSALVASGSYDRTVRLWDVVTGAAPKTLKGHTDGVYSVALSHNGALLASGSWDATIKLWDTARGVALKTLEGHRNLVSSVAFSRDGALLASGSYDNTIRLWDIVTGAALKSLEGHIGGVSSVVFSHDSAILASGSVDNMVKLWDIVTGAAPKTLEGHTDIVLSVAFSHDGALLASGSRKTIKLWDIVTGAALKTLESHMNFVWSVAFSHDGALLASSMAKTVQLWDVATGAALKTISVDSLVKILSFSFDGLFLETDHGFLPLEGLNCCYPFGNLPQPAPNLQAYLFLNGSWVVRNSERLLWLPRQHRGGYPAFRGNVLSLGHEDGRVTFIEWLFPFHIGQ